MNCLQESASRFLAIRAFIGRLDNNASSAKLHDRPARSVISIIGLLQPLRRLPDGNAAVAQWSPARDHFMPGPFEAAIRPRSVPRLALCSPA